MSQKLGGAWADLSDSQKEELLHPTMVRQLACGFRPKCWSKVLGTVATDQVIPLANRYLLQLWMERATLLDSWGDSLEGLELVLWNELRRGHAKVGGDTASGEAESEDEEPLDEQVSE